MTVSLIGIPTPEIRLFAVRWNQRPMVAARALVKYAGLLSEDVSREAPGVAGENYRRPEQKSGRQG